MAIYYTAWVIGGLTRQADSSLSPDQRRLILISTMIGVAASSFSNVLLVAALPQIASDLNSTTGVVAWVNIAPAIAFGVSMPLFGKLGDLYGHRRVFIGGWGIATLLTLFTALAPNVAWLIVLRTTSQLIGASTTPAAYGILARVFPAEERADAFGKVVAVMSASPVIGVVAGGPAVDAIGWRPMFVVQAAIAAVAVALAVRVLPETPRRPDVRFDLAGALTLAAGIVGVLLAINRMHDWGVAHRGLQVSLAIGILGMIAFVAVERRAAEPLLPLQWFARRDVGAPIVTNLFSHITLMGLAVSAPFMFKSLFGAGTITIAILTGLRPVFFSYSATRAAKDARRFGKGQVIQYACLILVAGSALTALAARFQSWPILLASIVATGWGVGYARPGLVTAVTNAVDERDAGVANGAMTMAGQIGSSIGQTVLIAMVSANTAAAYTNSGWVATATAAASVVAARQIRFRDPG